MKKWYTSKTLWVNVLMAIGVIAQTITGKEVLSAEVQGAIIIIVNFVLRIITKESLEW